MEYQSIDPAIYRKEPFEDRPDFAKTQPVPTAPPAPVSADSAFAGSNMIPMGKAALAQANETPATMLESAGAAMTQFPTKHVFDALTMPYFPPDKDFNPVTFMRQAVDFPMDPAQEKFMRESGSVAESIYKLQHMQEQNRAFKAMGDHPVVSTITGGLDPLYMGIDIASLGASRLARMAGASAGLSRTVGLGSAVSATYALGKVEQTVDPISETEVMLNALGNGAATAAFMKGGKVIPKDPSFPGAALHEVVQDIKAVHTGAVEASAVHAEERAAVIASTEKPKAEPAPTPVVEGVPKVEPVAEVARPAANDATLPRELAGAKPRYKTSEVKFESDLDKALYITAQDTKSKADGAYRAWLTEQGLSKSEIASMGAEVRAALKRAVPDEAGNLVLRRTAGTVAEDVKATPVMRAVADAGRAVGEPPFKYKPYSARGLLESMAEHPDPLVHALAKRLSDMLGNDIQVRATAKKNLMGGGKAPRPYYDPAHHAVYLAQDTPQHVQLHEITHAMTTYKLEYGLANRGTTHGRIASEIEQTWQDAKAAYKGNDLNTNYFLKDIHEFVAGVFSGKSAFTDMLANTPVRSGSTSILSDFVNSVRKLLGMKPSEVNALTQTLGLTEKLVGEKLNVTIKSAKGDADTSMSIRLSPPEQAAIHSVPDAQQVLSKKLAQNIEWSFSRTMGSFGEVSKKISKLLFDDPLDTAGNSVENQKRAIRADLHRPQIAFENAVQKQMAAAGFGTFNQIKDTRGAIKVQQRIEREAYMELLRRSELIEEGLPVHDVDIPQYIKDIADARGEVSKAALEELKRSGVSGAEAIEENAGHVSRRWDSSKIEAMENAFIESGLTEKDARLKVRDMLSVAMQRKNGWDAELAQDIAKATIERARSRGYFEDTAFGRKSGADGLAEIRSILTDSGISESRMQRAMDVLNGKLDEAGKPSMLKHRVGVAMDESLRLPNGEVVTVADMLDTGLLSITEHYLDGVAAQSALARKGLTKTSDLVALRSELAHSIADIGERGKAIKLFDQGVAHLRGEPVGEELNSFMRGSAAVTQMVSLGYSGLWQVTEYATMMGQYGAMATLKHVMQAMPGLRSLLTDPVEAGHLRNILTANSSQDIRLRPIIAKMEDNYDVPLTHTVQLALTQAKQLVPYLNGMKYIQKHQATVAANLIVNTFERAAKGDVKAAEMLRKYGLESHSMIKVSPDIAAYGMDTAKWSKETWDTVRAPLTKMMDDSVLHHRLGELPAFMTNSTLGKFLGTYRGFVFGAHNKVLAGSLHRDGFSGIGLILLYQYPLSMIMTATANTLSGKKPLTDQELVTKSFGQVGSLGLIGEAVGIATGKPVGTAPGLIAFDKAAKIVSSAASGSVGNTAAATLNMIPLLSILPIKAIGEQLKDK